MVIHPNEQLKSSVFLFMRSKDLPKKKLQLYFYAIITWVLRLNQWFVSYLNAELKPNLTVN